MTAYKSDQIALYCGRFATVTARPVSAGDQPAPEVLVRERGIEALSVSPESACALASALFEAAYRAEQPNIMTL